MNISNKALKAFYTSPFAIKVYKTPDNKFVEIENINGAVYAMWTKEERRYGVDMFEVTQPIVPNTKTGSSLSTLGGQDEAVTLEEVLHLIETGTSSFPSFFSYDDKKNTKHQTIEQSVNGYGNILGYEKISDRKRINMNRSLMPCIPVSEEFADEMLGCVPPQTMTFKDTYSFFQVGEISRHNSEGKPLYESFMFINDESILDKRMKLKQWYFIGECISK